jgi:hypothetical protein
VSDLDGDGRPDDADACPTEAAATLDGCPLPRVRSLRVRLARHHRVSARVRTDRAATIAVRIDRRSCRAHHHHRRCRYRRVAARTASGRRATLARRLSPGRYRVTVLLTSAAGRGATVHRALRVR